VVRSPELSRSGRSILCEMCLAARSLEAESCGGGWETLGNNGTGASRLRREPDGRKIVAFMSVSVTFDTIRNVQRLVIDVVVMHMKAQHSFTNAKLLQMSIVAPVCRYMLISSTSSSL
jgi:hypothetical protein